MHASRGRLIRSSISNAWFAVLVAAAGLATGCSLPPMDAMIYVDNSTKELLVVFVDGKERAAIEPGLSTKLEYPPGEYHFLVKSGERVLLDEKKKFEPSDNFAACRRYLLNPDAATKYQIYVLQYGESRLGDAMESGLLSMQKDPKARNQYLYNKLLKDITLLPEGAWKEIAGADFVLELPPNSVRSRTAIAKKKVLARISANDYSRVDLAMKREHPREKDVEALAELLDEILDKALAGPRAGDVARGD
jgi:hypothetical protein